LFSSSLLIFFSHITQSQLQISQNNHNYSQSQLTKFTQTQSQSLHITIKFQVIIITTFKSSQSPISTKKTSLNTPKKGRVALQHQRREEQHGHWTPPPSSLWALARALSPHGPELGTVGPHRSGSRVARRGLQGRAPPRRSNGVAAPT
jgi:hypothetical protein